MSSEDKSDHLFGDVLSDLLGERRQWNATSLAKALHIDPSLVRRWLHNERIPPLKSDYVRRIAECLRLSTAERHFLESAQIASYHARLQGKFVSRRIAEVEGVADILGVAAQGLPSAHEDNVRWPVKPVDLPPNGAPIRGVREVCLAAIELLRRACERESPSTIYWTFQSDRDAVEEAQLTEEWRESLRRVLQRGWQLEHVVRLDNDAERSIGLVKEILNSMGRQGAYMPHFVKGGVPSMLPIDMFVVSYVGALILFATENGERVDSAIYFSFNTSENTESDKLFDLFKQRFSLLKGMANPLLREYEGDTPSANDAILHMEKEIGDRFVMMDGPSAIGRPISLYINTPGEPSHMTQKFEDQSQSMNRAQERLDVILRQLSTNEGMFRDVYPTRAIEKLAHHGALFLKDKIFQDSKHALTPELRLEVLEILIARLQSFGNYQLALLDEEEESRLLGPREGEQLQSVWQIKGTQSVIFETWRGEKGHEKDITIEINEPTIVRAFWRYANGLWENISPLNKDKKYVIWWLERQIEVVKKLQSEQKAGEGSE